MAVMQFVHRSLNTVAHIGMCHETTVANRDIFVFDGQNVLVRHKELFIKFKINLGQIKRTLAMTAPDFKITFDIIKKLNSPKWCWRFMLSVMPIMNLALYSKT